MGVFLSKSQKSAQESTLQIFWYNPLIFQMETTGGLRGLLASPGSPPRFSADPGPMFLFFPAVFFLKGHMMSEAIQ